jgi:CBS domain-containing protein
MESKNIMSSHIISVGQNEPVSAAARLLKKYNIGALPVHDDRGSLKGIVTDRDIVLRCVALDGDPQETRVREIMSRNLCTVDVDTPLEAVAQTMAREQVRRVPVMENQRMVGMISLGDVARQGNFTMEAASALSEISLNLRRCL